MIILAGAIGLDCVQKMSFAVGTELFRWRREREKRHYLSYTGTIMVLFVGVAGLAGLSRITALYTNYQGSLTILHNLPATETEKVVCYGKEWYRSPSSFHLPSGYKMRFIQSEFNGQMPAPYADTQNASRLIHPYLNDQNKGDNSTYYKPKECHYLVDSDLSKPSKLQPAYHKDPNWEVVATASILNAERSNRILRAFYIPFLTSKNCVYGNMYLLKNKSL